MEPFDPDRTVSTEELNEQIRNYETYLRMTGEPREVIREKANTLRESLGLPAIKSEEIPFPPIMNGIAGDFSKLYSTYLEVPQHFLFMSFLTCLGSVLSDRLTLNTELSPQPRLFTILLGESADDHKSTAIDKVVSFFKNSLTEFNVCHGVGSAEGLQIRLNKNNKLLLALDEFKSFINKCKIESSVLLPCTNTLFESNLYESHTKTSNISIDDAYLSILAASTVQTYERVWTSNFTDIGFNNRLWLVPGTAERRFSFPAQIPEEDKKKLADALAGILMFVDENRVLDLSQDAKEAYQNWYMNMESSVHTKRLDTYALRLMPLLAANEYKDQIDLNIIEKAIALADWQLEVRRLHDPIDSENVIAKLEEKIRRCLTTGAKKDWEIKQKIGANRSGLWFYETAKRNLVKYNEITWDKKSGCYQLKEKF